MANQIQSKAKAQPGLATSASAASVAPARKRFFARRASVALALAIILGAGAAVWWTLGRETPIRYATQAATRGTVMRAVTATGTVNPVLTIIVGSYVSGVIQQVTCDYNTTVHQQQVCAKIDPRPYQTVVDQDRANLANAEAQLAKDQAGLAYAKLNNDRLAKLVTQDSVSRDAADSAKSGYDQALAQIQLDEASIAQHEAALQAAQVNLDYTNIVSPVDGTVVSRNVTVGQTVAASFQTPTLFLIATNLTEMQVDTNVSESDIGTVREGNPASFTVEAFPDRVFTGHVSQVRQAPQTVQNVVTYDVVVSVDNADLALKPGMTATAKIVTAQRDDVLRVPDQALRYQPAGEQAATQGAQVWVLRGGKPVAVPVTLGLDDDSFSEVVAGELKPADAVIMAEQRGAPSAAASRPRLFGF